VNNNYNYSLRDTDCFPNHNVASQPRSDISTVFILLSLYSFISFSVKQI